MAYIKQNWVNGETIATAERMNHIEDGIKANETTLDTINESLNNINENLDKKLDKTSVKTTQTSSDTDIYSCNYVNNKIAEKITVNGTYASGVTGEYFTATKNSSNVVFIRIWVKKTLVLSSWNVLGTIPAGYRPTTRLDGIGANNNNDLGIHVRISTNGEISVYPASETATATSTDIIFNTTYII